jgi:hypothetical protein
MVKSLSGYLLLCFGFAVSRRKTGYPVPENCEV